MVSNYTHKQRIADLERQLEDLRKDDQISECACCGYAGDNLPAYRNLLKQAHNDNREKRIANLEAENEHLENLLAEGVHTCSKTCKRPLCVLRREKAELEQQLERAFKEGYHRGHDHTVEGCFQWCNEGTNDVYQDWLKEQESGD